VGQGAKFGLGGHFRSVYGPQRAHSCVTHKPGSGDTVLEIPKVDLAFLGAGEQTSHLMRINVTTYHQRHNIIRFWLPEPNFPRGYPSWYYSRKSTLNCGVLKGHGHYGFKTRCVKKSANIHISIYSFLYPGNVGPHN
jgi:hypothetical protein